MRVSLPLVLSLGLFAGAGLVLVAARTGTAAPPAVDVKIAVVEVLSVIESSPQWTRIQSAQGERDKAVKALKLQKSQELQALRTALEAMGRTHPNRRQKEEEIVRANALAEADVKIKEAQALDDYTKDLEEVYKSVKAVVQTVATEEGYGIVLFATSDPFNLATPSPREFLVNVGIRSVVWADNAVNLTEAVKKRLASMSPPGNK